MLEKPPLHIDFVGYKKGEEYYLVNLYYKHYTKSTKSLEDCVRYKTRHEVNDNIMEDLNTQEILDMWQYTWTSRYLKSTLTKKLIPFVV
jgi:hypothetical protein